MKRIYDEIGRSYATTRQPDDRIARAIGAALEGMSSVVNVGAGAGSYEPSDRPVLAVEPSATMIRQRGQASAPVVQGTAEALPVADARFDAAMAILTIHHWADLRRGLAELRRVSRKRVVILTWDEEVWETFWLIREYLPGIADIDRPRSTPIPALLEALGSARAIPMPIPHDCTDGFFGAWWRRPEAYLDPHVRAGISSLVVMDPPLLEEGLGRLADDLESGAWAAAHPELLDLEAIDLGYRLIVAE